MQRQIAYGISYGQLSSGDPHAGQAPSAVVAQDLVNLCAEGFRCRFFKGIGFQGGQKLFHPVQLQPGSEITWKKAALRCQAGKGARRNGARLQQFI